MIPSINLSNISFSPCGTHHHEKETTSKAHFERGKARDAYHPVHAWVPDVQTLEKNQFFTQFMPRPGLGPNAKWKAVVARVQPDEPCGWRHRDEGEVID